MQLKKKVLLINPYNPKSDHIQPPLGLGYLATALRKNGLTVEILDANKKRVSVGELPRIIGKIKPDFVGFQFYTLNLNYVREGHRLIKRINSEIITLVGGPHPSALPYEIFQTLGKPLDFAFAGEAEIGLPTLIKKINENSNTFANIPGLIYRKNKKTYVNPPLFFKDIDKFGSPAWDLLKPESYPEAQHGAFFKNFPIAPIITTRGCPYQCSFCAARLNNGPFLRKRAPVAVVNEIETLYKQRGIREFHIVDDNFTLDKDHAAKILKGIIKLKLKATLAVPNGIRLDTLDKEILKLMKKAGFYLISVGIESGSDRILKMMNKNLMTGQIREKIKLIKRTGLDVAGFFILGYPGETEKEIRQTINFSLNLGLLRANYFLFLPLPGTPIYENLKKQSKIKAVNWEKASFTTPAYDGEIKKEKLKKLQREAFIKFFLWRPQILLANLLKIKRPKQFFFLLKRAINWLA